MKEGLSQAPGSTTLDKEVTPFRGFFSKTAVRQQLQNYLPELFDTENSLTDGLFSSDDAVYISVANEREIGYSFNHCRFCNTEYPLIELTITHHHLMQIHSEELVFPANPFVDEGKDVASKEHPYAYGGWNVHVLMGSPFINQKVPQMLQLEWAGKDQFGQSETLLVAYMDMFGNGQRMLCDFAQKTIALPHMHQVIPEEQSGSLPLLQLDQPFIFDEIIMDDALVGIMFHGTEENHVAKQQLTLPRAMHARYPG